MQHLLDMNHDSTIRCLHGSYTIPSHTKKIFTTNSPDIFQCKDWDLLSDAQRGSVTRRFRVVKINGKLY